MNRREALRRSGLLKPNAILQWAQSRERKRQMLSDYLDTMERRWGVYGCRDAIVTAFCLRGPMRSHGVHAADVLVWLNEAMDHCRVGRLPHLPLDDCIEATL